MFNKEAFIQYYLNKNKAIEDELPFFKETTNNVVNSALNSKELDVPFQIISDILPNCTFGEVAMFATNSMLTESGQAMKYDYLVDFKMGYHELNVFVRNEIIYTFNDSDGDLDTVTTIDELTDYVDLAIENIKAHFDEQNKEFPFSHNMLNVLKSKMLKTLSQHLCIKMDV
jgi:hypothetical protein